MAGTGMTCIGRRDRGGVPGSARPPTRRISLRARSPSSSANAAGGIADVTTRIYAEVMSKSLNQKIVVENRPAGQGAVAAVATQNAAPDGHTLLTITGSAHAALPAMQAGRPLTIR